MNKDIWELVKEFLKQNGPIAFEDIWQEIIKDERFKDLDDGSKSKIFADLNLNRIFVNLGNNKFDLRDKHEFSVKKNVPVYSDDE